mmetsp:Transcript_14380/g.32848  ORF Transcript_14380/g.32848 Transcript_14380/m.32848 type:complete len:142 (-) Transcript_14380:491-916(-)
MGGGSGALVPIRFLAMLAHLLALIVFALSRKDNVIVSLKFDYSSSEFNDADREMLAACLLMVGCFLVLSFGFFGGFSMFSPGLALLHTTLHVIGGILLSVTVLDKWHYVTVWYTFGFFSALPACVELGAIFDVLVMHKARW